MIYIITTKSVSVFLDGEQRTITASHPAFEQMREAIKNNNEDKVRELFNVKKRIEKFGQGEVEYRDGVVYYKGEPINNYLTKKIVQLQREGFTIKPLLNFLENLQDNPSYRAREELYQFLEYGDLPITEDGYFIAYKKVRDDYKDIWSGQFDNSVGAVCEMDRREVDDDSDRTCSAGLHFASREYMAYYGSANANKVMAIKINPADVVSIPRDYNNTKGRCCRYEVVEELGSSADFDTLEDGAVFGGEQNSDKEVVDTLKKGEAADYEGVTWDKHVGKFKAQFKTYVKGQSRHIGYFTNAKKAHKAYKKAVKKTGRK